MEETAKKSAELLLNYGVLGVVCILLFIGGYLLIKYVLTREKHHEAKYDSQRKEQLDLTLEFTRMASEFKNSANAFKESEDKHTDALTELNRILLIQRHQQQ